MIDDGDEGKKRCALKYLVSGGEKISDEVLKMWAGREDVILANFYGCVLTLFFPRVYYALPSYLFTDVKLVFLFTSLPPLRFCIVTDLLKQPSVAPHASSAQPIKKKT